jgi:hypothetical protein
MRYSDFAEQIGTIGTTATPMGAAPPGTPPSTPPASGLTGNVGAMQDPRMQAADLAKQKQQKDQQKKAIQDQIAALQKQLSDLNMMA